MYNENYGNQNQQYGINVMAYDQYDIYTMAFVAGATVTITGTIAWSGTTDASGYAIDGSNLKPSLPYGSYSVTVSKTGYNTSSPQPFTVPLTGSVNITITKIYQSIDIIVSE